MIETERAPAADWSLMFENQPSITPLQRPGHWRERERREKEREREREREREGSKEGERKNS